jgi:hypothetical protein
MKDPEKTGAYQPDGPDSPLFGDNYLSALATIKNPHWGVFKTLRRGGLVKRSEPERR